MLRRRFRHDSDAVESEVLAPDLFASSPYLSDDINHNIIQSEIEGGVYLRDLDCGTVLTVETEDWTCTMIYCEEREVLVCGHPWICPKFVKVHVNGSTWGGTMLKEAFIGRGMHLEFLHPRYGLCVTSVILNIHEQKLTNLISKAA